MISFIPNMLTSLNLIFGVIAIIYVMQGDFFTAALLIFGAMVADGLDGRVARYFNVSGEFGKELDSLCDLVSFGVAPGLLAYKFLLEDLGLWGMLIAALFATCGAMRLARFNVNVGIVKGYFMGVPIPAGGCTIATFSMMELKPPVWQFALMVIVVAFLMVSTIRYPDFKGKGEKFRLIPAVLALLAGVYVFYVGKLAAILFVPFFVYILYGLLNAAFNLLN